jgi:hypothetical protein
VDLNQFEKMVLKTSLDKKTAEINATLANEKALRDVPNKDNVISNLKYELVVIKGLIDKFKLV